MRNPDTPPTPPLEGQPVDREPAEVEVTKKTVVEKSLVWADAGDALEAAQTDQITPEQEARLAQEFEAADLALRESLEELQQIAGIEAMLEVLGNLESLGGAEETNGNSLKTPNERPLA